MAEEDFAKAAALAREARARSSGGRDAREALDAGDDGDVRRERSAGRRRLVSGRIAGRPEIWESLGQTPLGRSACPRASTSGESRSRASRPRTQIAPTWALGYGRSLTFRLEPAANAPAGMVRVPGGKIGLAIPGLDHLPRVPLDDYWIDRHEVTNEEYRKFVDAGGLPEARLLEAALRRETAERSRGTEAMAALPRHDGAPGPGDVGAGELSEGPGEAPGRGRELVRGGGVRRVRREEPPDGLPLEPCRADAGQSAHRAGEQLPGHGDSRRRRRRRRERLRHDGHGGQRQGVVLEREHGRQEVHSRRRLRRADVHVHRPGRAVALGSQAELRIPVRQALLAAASGRGREDRSPPSGTTRRRSRSPTRSSAPTRGSTPTTRAS